MSENDPEGFQDKVTFWVGYIRAFLRARNGVIFTLSEIKSSCAIAVGEQPACLDDIIKHLAYHQIITEIDTFQASYHSLSSRMLHSITSPFRRALAVVSPAKAQPTFVVEDCIQEAVAKMLESCRPEGSISDSWSSTSTHIQNTMKWSEAEFEVILSWLRYHRKALSVTDKDGLQVVKFAAKDGQVSSVTQTDISTVRLRVTEQKLSVFENNLQSRIKQITADAVKFQKLGNKERVIALLQHRKHIKTVADRHFKTIQNVQLILLSIEQAQNDQEALSALSAGAKALHSLTSATSLADEIDNVLEEVENELAEARIVDDAWNSGMDSINATTSIDEEALIAELELLELEQSQPQFPAVPETPVARQNVPQQQSNGNVKKQLVFEQ
eukprot:c1270_g1_i1.p1 GENE.c1270_g1_i1~~c1270_g1_i1.p1  ORF type:complete len:406 (+),score=109.80 c1270_g1_i1:66-1220(+)